MKKVILLFAFIMFSSVFSFAEAKFKPFVLAYINQKSISDNISEIKNKLKDKDINIVGEYAPYDNAHIIIITDSDMIENASKSKNGGFGAMIRISITKTNDETQISYNNPIYLSHVYQLKSTHTGILDKLKSSLGFIKEFGSEKSYTVSELKSYHYKFLMPYFEDVIELASFNSYAQATKAVSDGLSNNKYGVGKVYKIDISASKSSVFGVSMSQKSSNDKYIMGEIDFKKTKSTAHLPYEVLVVKGEVYILPAEFRIAINFPELSMMGDNSFMNIMASPEDIKEVLKNSIIKE